MTDTQLAILIAAQLAKADGLVLSDIDFMLKCAEIEDGEPFAVPELPADLAAPVEPEPAAPKPRKRRRAKK